jgi:probable HAF family extracellular repeat protein
MIRRAFFDVRDAALRRAATRLACLLLIGFAVDSTAQTSSPLPLRINVGGPAYVDADGNAWLADTGTSVGNVFAIAGSQSIAGTPDPALYRTGRWDPWAAPALNYSFPVPNGTYQVRLHFAEIWDVAFAPGVRVFDVQIERQLAIDDLDIFAVAGANRAYVRTVTVGVTDGRLDIALLHQIQNPTLNGIEILPSPAAAPPRGPARYRLTDLGAPGGAVSVGYDINDSGWVTGAFRDDGWQAPIGGDYPGPVIGGRPFVWKDGVLSPIAPTGASLSFQDAAGVFINERGDVAVQATLTVRPYGQTLLWYGPGGSPDIPIRTVVSGFNDGGWAAVTRTLDPTPAARRAVVWYAGGSIELPLLGAPPVGQPDFRSSNAAAINASGWIAGSATYDSRSDSTSPHHAILWNGTSTWDLGTLGGADSRGQSINDRGWVAGTATTVTEATRIASWSADGVRDLGTLGVGRLRVDDMSPSGWVIGTDTSIDPQTLNELAVASFISNGVDPVVSLGSLGGDFTRALDVSAQGWVVGTATIASGEQRAFRWVDGEIADLNALIDAADPLRPYVTLRNAVRFNTRGQILANGVDSRGGARAFVLTPVTATATAKPVINSSVTGTRGPSDWYRSDVEVRWTVTSADSPISGSSGCGDVRIAADTAGTTLTCAATNAAGTQSETVIVRRDATAPVVAASPRDPPNANGWFNGPVTIQFSATDSGSGVEGCVPDVVVTGEGVDLASPAGTCTDRAGNVGAAVRAAGLRIDLGAPVLSASRVPIAAATGWVNEPVTVSFSASDALSGVAANACTAPVVIGTDGANQSALGVCRDLAGNAGEMLLAAIAIDRTPPTATARASAAPNGAGWYREPVTVSFAGTDSLSGSGLAGCSAPLSVADEGRAVAASGTCRDVAGNTSPVAALEINLDRTAPTISASLSGTGSYRRGAAATLTYTCGDALSGVATCASANGPSGGALPTEQTGKFTRTINAADVAGNIAARTVTYVVLPGRGGRIR